MTFGQRLSASFSQFKKSPSLLTVMVLEFILSVLLGMLFFIGNLAIIVYLNETALGSISREAMDIQALINIAMNARTIITMGILLVLQGIIFVYMDSFFKSGFYGMLKNAVHDGSTTFQEFVPEAKRYWHPMFRFLLLRYALIVLFGIPFFIALLMFAGTNPALISTGQVTFFIGSLIVFVIALLLIFFWLFYGEAVIVFEDATAKQAVRDSTRLAKQNFKLTAGSFLVIAAMIIVAAIIESIIVMPFDYLAQNVASMQVLRDFVRFILNIITISAGIIASIFIFLTYDHLTTKREVRRPAAKISKIKRKA
jgi:hypothetical protein